MDFDLAGVGDHVVVGEDVAFLIDDEARALAFLGNQSVEEVERDGLGGDVHDRRDVLAVDEDVVLLFGVERFAGSRLRDLDFDGAIDPVRKVQGRGFPGGEVKKGSRQQDCQQHRPQ